MNCNDYTTLIIEILKQNKLTLCTCECGTNGLVSSLLSKHLFSSQVFKGGIVINDLDLLKRDKIDKYLEQTMLNFKTEMIVCSYYEYDSESNEEKLNVIIQFLDKIYKKEIREKMDCEKQTIKTLIFLYELLQKINKKYGGE
ncbi:MAG: CinA family protein [Mycoplasmataceae bacterium]|nr:CinA family protein [Mycoplasmataceae bacterium]